MNDETQLPTWPQSKPPSGGSLPPVGFGNGAEARCKNCGSSAPPGVRFCPTCGSPMESARAPRGPRRTVVLVAALLAVVGIGVGIWRLVDSGGNGHPAGQVARKGGGEASPKKPPTGGPRHHAEIATIKQRVLTYGSTRSRTKTCSLETQRKKLYLFRVPSRCPALIAMRIVHYRILSVKVRGSQATVEVTGELGRETLWLIRTPGQGWQVDGLYRFRTPAGQSPRTRSATA